MHGLTGKAEPFLTTGGGAVTNNDGLVAALLLCATNRQLLVFLARFSRYGSASCCEEWLCLSVESHVSPWAAPLLFVRAAGVRRKNYGSTSRARGAARFKVASVRKGRAIPHNRRRSRNRENPGKKEEVARFLHRRGRIQQKAEPFLTTRRRSRNRDGGGI